MGAARGIVLGKEFGKLVVAASDAEVVEFALGAPVVVSGQQQAKAKKASNYNYFDLLNHGFLYDRYGNAVVAIKNFEVGKNHLWTALEGFGVGGALVEVSGVGIA